jgi:hypothetical protein
MESDNNSLFVAFPSSSSEDRNARQEWFVGDIAEWAKIRARKLGDLIVPKHMYIEWVDDERHNVAWIEHFGANQDSGELYHIHHVACDCIRQKDPETIEDVLSSNLDCPVVHNALTERAYKIDRDYRINETLKALKDLATEEYHEMVLAVIENTLLFDKEHPDYWMANIVSGQHHADLMSEILHIPTPSVQLYAGILELQGKIEVEGKLLRLKETA